MACGQRCGHRTRTHECNMHASTFRPSIAASTPRRSGMATRLERRTRTRWSRSGRRNAARAALRVMVGSRGRRSANRRTRQSRPIDCRSYDERLARLHPDRQLEHPRARPGVSWVAAETGAGLPTKSSSSITAPSTGPETPSVARRGSRSYATTATSATQLRSTRHTGARAASSSCFSTPMSSSRPPHSAP